VEGSLRHIPCREDASLDLIPVDHVAESIVRLTADARCVGETYHLCAGPERRTPVRHLLEAAVRAAGRPGAALPRFAPLRNGGTLPDGTPPRLRVFFAYLDLDREFSVDRVRSHLGASPLPEDDDFVPALVGFCSRTDWGRSREEVPS
jgi:nucleoside-diphosphate-sugar epimerase